MERLRHAKVIPFALLLASLHVPLAVADITDPSKLESLKQEVDTSLERKKELEAEAKAIAADVTKTRRALITSAVKVQKSEAEVSASEARLAELNEAEIALLAQLKERRARMSELLGALARLDRNPPPALAVKPNDALGAMRGAILLGDAVPELRAEADLLKRRLDELQALRHSILAERATLAQATASLERDRADLEDLLNTKLARQKKLTADATSEEARANRLSRQATDLTDLISQLENQAQNRQPLSRPSPQPVARRPVAAPPSSPTGKDGKETELALLSPPSEPAPLPSSRLFSEAKGLIRLPATGLLVSGFGINDGAGGHTEGMTIATRPGAQVVAPFDGKIVYAGPFRRYGQLLILSVGEGYHLLLAGMATINGQVGQSVLAGEPVGRMEAADGADHQPSSQENAKTRQKTATDGRPSLYIEFRKDSDPIDPRPWLKMSDKKARG
jgi:septal ring factor EnvC (AmiA/AmiB activator)